MLSLHGNGSFRFARFCLLCTARCVASYDTQARLAGWSTEKEESSGETLPGKGRDPDTHTSSMSVLKHHESAQLFSWKRDLSGAKRWREDQQHPCVYQRGANSAQGGLFLSALSRGDIAYGTMKAVCPGGVDWRMYPCGLWKAM